MNGKYRNSRRRFTLCGNSPLPAVEDRLFFILVYLKNNPLQEYHAACFDMEQKQCNRFIHVLYSILEQSLRDAGVMPADSQKNLSNILKALSEDREEVPVLLHDGTEREIPVRSLLMNSRKITAGRKRNIPLTHLAVISSYLPDF